MFDAGQRSAKLAQGRMVRAVICGEAGAGKSTVISAMLRDNLVPTGLADEFAFTLDTRPTQTVHRQGERPSGLDLVEVCDLRAGHIDAATRQTIRESDLMIWVTVGSQAWKLSEKAILDDLGVDCPARKLLAVSRADKFRHAAGALRVRQRLEEETAAYFSEIVFVFGGPRLIAEAAHSESAWFLTGGRDLYEKSVDPLPSGPAEAERHPSGFRVIEGAERVARLGNAPASIIHPRLVLVEPPADASRVRTTSDDAIAAAVAGMSGLACAGFADIEDGTGSVLCCNPGLAGDRLPAICVEFERQRARCYADGIDDGDDPAVTQMAFGNHSLFIRALDGKRLIFGLFFSDSRTLGFAARQFKSLCDLATASPDGRLPDAQAARGLVVR